MRITLPIATALLATAGLAAGAGAQTIDARTRLAGVRVVECVRSNQADQRTAVFHGRMRAVPGTRRMWMRFTLLERAGDGPFRRVHAPKLGRWHRSLPGVRTFGYRQRVRGLAEGAVYRARVDFRWYGEGRAPIRRARRRSGPCRQPGRLANLRVTRLGRSPGPAPGTTLYKAYVVNTGAIAAANVAVSLSVDGATVDKQTIARMEPGDARLASFVGPACRTAKSPVRATVDPGHTIRESSERDNVLEATCGSLRRR